MSKARKVVDSVKDDPVAVADDSVDGVTWVFKEATPTASKRSRKLSEWSKKAQLFVVNMPYDKWYLLMTGSKKSMASKTQCLRKTFRGNPGLNVEITGRSVGDECKVYVIKHSPIGIEK